MLKFFALAGFAGTFFIAGFLMSWTPAYSAGVVQGRSEPQNLKVLALKDPKVTSKVCSVWWFGTTHKDRRIKP